MVHIKKYCKKWILLFCSWCSVTQSCPTLQPHGPQHERLPVPQHLLKLNFCVNISQIIKCNCIWQSYLYIWVSQETLLAKNPPTKAGDVRYEGLIPGLGRSPGEGNGYPLQYSCLENPMHRGAWWAAVYGVTVRHDWAQHSTSKSNQTFCS